MLELLGSWIIHFISTFGYVGIFILMTLESALIPIPSEVTMPFSGSLVQTGEFNFMAVVLAGTLGNLIGSLLAYWLGHWGEEALVRNVIRKYGKYVLVTEHEYEQSERWFRRHGEPIVFIARILPVLRTFISLPAGIAKMKLPKFIAYTVIGSAIWSVVLTYIGVLLGKNWHSIGTYFHQFDAVLVVVGAIAVVWYIRRKINHLRHHSPPTA